MEESATPHSAIVAAGRTVRSELPELLGADGAALVEPVLGELLAQAAAASNPTALAEAEDRILEVLATHPRTRARMNELLPAVDEERGAPSGYEPLPGGGEPVEADWYGCPQGDYDWPVFAVDEPVPQCPVHHVALVPKPRFGG
jgi:hypothetical protein